MHLDLAGIIQVVLNALDDLAGHQHHLIVTHGFGLDNDTDFPSRLDGVGTFHPVKGAGDFLKLFKTLDVVLQVLAPGARTGSGNGVSRLNQAGDDGFASTSPWWA